MVIREGLDGRRYVVLVAVARMPFERVKLVFGQCHAAIETGIVHHATAFPLITATIVSTDTESRTGNRAVWSASAASAQSASQYASHPSGMVMSSSRQRAWQWSHVRISGPS